MIRSSIESEKSTLELVADMMVTAAKTAPKGSGKDNVVSMILSGDEKLELSDTMRKLSEEYGEAFIERDANNLDECDLVVIIGVKYSPFGLNNCHLCGFENCNEMHRSGAMCAFNITDLGIAIGSAVSIAADHRVDNRVMYSVGKAVIANKLFNEDVRICYGIPLSATSKSIFFDRAPGSVLR